MHNSNYSLFLVLSTPAPAEPSLSQPFHLGCACSGWRRRREAALSSVGGELQQGPDPSPAYYCVNLQQGEEE